MVNVRVWIILLYPIVPYGTYGSRGSRRVTPQPHANRFEFFAVISDKAVRD